MGRHDDRARALNVDRLGGLAEVHHELTRARTGEGRERAVANGVRLGRKPTSLIISSARRSVAAIMAARRVRRWGVATMLAAGRFRGCNKAMSLLIADCPRCGASSVTFDVYAQVLSTQQYEALNSYEVFSV